MTAGPTATSTPITLPVEIKVAGILFDMDGVLISSTLADERCWTRWATQNDLDEIFDLRGTHGHRAVDTIREYFPNVTDAELNDHMSSLNAMAGEELSGITVYPGVHNLLAFLPPNRWTVVTSAEETLMRSRLAAVGIVVPRHTVGGDTVKRGKPDPEGYLRGAALLSRQPHECLVIEDAPAGILAGKSAGCQVLAVASSHYIENLQQADWIVASLDQIQLSIDDTATLNLRFSTITSMH
jgi:mannitol-1-/sugar-/sorbitol-6-phosphatase